MKRRRGKNNEKEMEFFKIILIYLFILFGSMWLLLFIANDRDLFYIGTIYGIWITIFTWWWFIKIPGNIAKKERKEFEEMAKK
ncbi:MAG: hypothetical protein AAB696_01790 [Patescibacteria group bacterium]